MFFKEHRKPFPMNIATFHSMARDYGDGNSSAWNGREVILSTVGADISIKAYVKPAPHVAAPRSSLAAELADVLSRAITTPHDQSNMVKTMREAADLLLARH